MFGFLTKSKSKTDSKGAQGSASGGASSSDVLKDPVQDPLAAKATAAATTDKKDEQKKEEAKSGPGFFDKLFKTAKYKESQDAKVTEVMDATQPKLIRQHYWDELYQFAASEFSTENMDLIEAINSKATPSSIYNLWIKTGAPMEVNFDAKVVAPLHELAGKGLYDSMSFDGVLKVAESNLADTVSRFKTSPIFREAVRKRIS